MASRREILRDIYEQHHSTGKRYGFTFGGEERAKQVAAWLGTGKHILDIGCRDGTLTRHFATGNTVVGIDVDTTALELCRERLGIETHWVDVTEGLPFEDASFDAVNCGEVMEHLPFPNRLVAEVGRVLKPDGLFVGSVPNSFRLKSRLLFLAGRDFEPDPTHLRHFSPASLRRMLDASFQSVEIQFVSSRFLRLSPGLMGNIMLFRASSVGCP
jgi:SAM-dependent methyltransferase